jgi:hypothetical protein
MKKLWITLIILAVSATTALFAQEKSSFNIMQDRFAYMREHLTLSEKEGDAFWKTYSQYLKDEAAIMDTYRKNLEKQGIKLGKPGTNKETIEKLSDKQLTYMHDQKFEMRKKISDLEIAYYKKYKAILTPRHIQQLFDLEYKFKKSLTTKNKGEKKEVPANISGSKKKR